MSTESESQSGLSSLRSIGSPLFQEVLDADLLKEGDKLYLEYGPRGQKKQKFEGIVRKDGIEVGGRVFSPSYAAVYCIQKAGSKRKTANGWSMWKTDNLEQLDSIYKRLKIN